MTLTPMNPLSNRWQPPRDRPACRSQGRRGTSQSAALQFGKESWAELAPLSLDSDTPFSIGMWVYQPEDEGNSWLPVNTTPTTTRADGR